MIGTLVAMVSLLYLLAPMPWGITLNHETPGVRRLVGRG